MTSVKQFEANRRYSLKSMGPKTEAGKWTSRCNAVRHGLTAETVIGALEDAEDYKAVELAITVPSTASVAMKPHFGVKLGGLYLRSTIWIASSYMTECGVRLGGEQASRHAPDRCTAPAPAAWRYSPRSAARRNFALKHLQPTETV